MGTRSRFRRIVGVVAALLAMAPAGIAAGAAGDLDPTFGVGGKAITDFAGRTEFARSIAVRQRGGFVVAGQSFAGAASEIALAAYSPGGSLDQSFGVGGRVLTDLGGLDGANAVAVDQDGRVVVAGETTVGSVHQFAVVRYDRDGSLDETFGNGGIVRTQIPGSTGDFASAIVLQPHGKILVVGTSNQPVPERQDFALVRYEDDGSLDAGFGTDGIVVTDIRDSVDIPSAVGLQPNGTIVVAGMGGGGLFSSDFAVARYDRHGRLDDSFGEAGVVLVDLGLLDVARDLVVRLNGRVVMAGSSGDDIVLVGLDEDGALNGDFGSAGIVRTDLGSFDDSASAIATARSGQLVVAGYRITADFTNDFAVLRYERDGELDDSFGLGGVVASDLGGGTSESAIDVAVDSDGIVAAGTIQSGVALDFVAVRYQTR